MLTIFNFSGKLPLAKETLTKNARGSDISSLIVFKIVTGTLYGPEDLLTSTWTIKIKISCEGTGDRKIDLDYLPLR